jgi:hypothetical protein
MRPVRAALCALLVSFALPSAATAADPPPFEVGAAKADANPPTGQLLCLGGYGDCANGKGRTMTGIKDHLYARAIAIGAGRNGMILVTTTNVGFFAAYKAPGVGIYHLRQAVAKRTGLSAGSVIVQSDHSHSGPDTIGIWGGVPTEYVKRMQDAAVDASVAAWRARVPADVFVGTAQGTGVTSSYRTGPNVGQDQELRLLWATSKATGKRVGTYTNYSPHATVLGSSNKLASGDWPEWASQIAEARFGGTGVAGVGTLGREDFGTKKEADARARLDMLMTRATDAARRVPPDAGVAVRSTFIREPIAQPILELNQLPEGSVNMGGYDLSIDRSTASPFNDGATVGTFAGAARVGDVFFGMSPGEPFPQIQFYLREQGAVTGTSAHFHLGATNDFLGYMVRPVDDYVQTFGEGAGFLLGCPEEEVFAASGTAYDPACPDHWTLMVSPTIGTHVACTIQNAANTLRFGSRTRDQNCAGTTATDGTGAPAEAPAGDLVPGAGASEPAGGGGAGGRRCTSRRTVTVRLRGLAGVRVRSLRATAGKRVVSARRTGRTTVAVTLRGLVPARYRVTVVARTARGRTVRASRVFRTCARKRA